MRDYSNLAARSFVLHPRLLVLYARLDECSLSREERLACLDDRVPLRLYWCHNALWVSVFHLYFTPTRGAPRVRARLTSQADPAGERTARVLAGYRRTTAGCLVDASVSANTRRAYAGALGQLDAWLGGRQLDDSALAAYLMTSGAEVSAAAADPVPRTMNLISIARAHAKLRQRTLDGDQVRDDLGCRQLIEVRGRPARDLIQVRAYASHLGRDSRYGLVTILRMTPAQNRSCLLRRVLVAALVLLAAVPVAAQDRIVLGGPMRSASPAATSRSEAGSSALPPTSAG